MNQADDDKRGDHGEHRHHETATQKTDSHPHGSPANRAHNQCSLTRDWPADPEPATQRWAPALGGCLVRLIKSRNPRALLHKGKNHIDDRCFHPG